MQRKEDRGDKCPKPIALISSFLERENLSNDKNKSDDNQDNCYPAQFGPKPKPIAFRMNCALFVKRRGAERREDRIKISETYSNPGRIAKQMEDVRENPPPEISREADAAEIPKMKAFEGLSPKNQQRRTKEQQKGKYDREFGR